MPRGGGEIPLPQGTRSYMDRFAIWCILMSSVIAIICAIISWLSFIFSLSEESGNVTSYVFFGMMGTFCLLCGIVGTCGWRRTSPMLTASFTTLAMLTLIIIIVIAFVDWGDKNCEHMALHFFRCDQTEERIGVYVILILIMVIAIWAGIRGGDLHSTRRYAATLNQSLKRANEEKKDEHEDTRDSLSTRPTVPLDSDSDHLEFQKF